MAWWTDHVVPRLVDASLGQQPVTELREQVCRGLHGRVLEIGFGSGLNLASLPPGVTAVDAVEPSEVAWRRSSVRRSRSPFPVERIGLDGQRIDAPPDTYDAALCTFALCTIPDPALALQEVRRVLEPGARLHFLEHGRSPEPGVQRWQRRLEPVQRRLAGGCHLTRDPVELVEAAGFAVEQVTRDYLAPGPAKPFAWLSRGVARVD